MSRATINNKMLAAIWNAGMVIPMTLKINWPAKEKSNKTPAATQHARPAVRMR